MMINLQTDEVNILYFFEANVKNIRPYSTIEKNNFKLVRECLRGEIEDKLDGNSSACLSDDFIDNSYQQIEAKIKSLNANSKIKEALKKNLADLKNSIELYKIYEKFIRTDKKPDKQYIKEHAELRSKIIYYIIEFRVTLGIELTDINSYEINNYGVYLACDVNNKNYERLTFNSHISDDGEVSLYKKRK